MKEIATYLSGVMMYCWSVVWRAFHIIGDTIVEQYGWVIFVAVVAFLADNHSQLPSWIAAVRKQRWRDVMAKKRWRNLNYRRTLTVAGFFLTVFLVGAGFQLDQDRMGEIERLGAKIKELTPRNKLDLYWNADQFAIGKREVQYSLTITNRSNRRMNLSFAGNFYFLDRNKKTRRLTLRGEMNPKEMKVGTGATQLSLPGGGSEVCSLIYFLPDAKEYDKDEWTFESGDGIAIMVFDSVTGFKEFFKASMGYPEGRIEEKDLPNADVSQAVLHMQVEVLPDDTKK